MTFPRAVALMAIFLALLSPPAHAADPVEVQLFPSNLTLHPGDSSLISGIFTNTTGNPLFIQGVLEDLTPPADFTLDDSPLFLDPAFAPGAASVDTLNSEGLVNILNINVGTDVPNGVYNGTITFKGGPTVNSDLIIGSATYTLSVVPEPGVLGMLVTSGFCGGLYAFRKRRFARR